MRLFPRTVAWLVHVHVASLWPERGTHIAMQESEDTMITNEGTVDRTLRIILGLALLSLTFVGPRSLLGLVGLVPLATGLIGVCPLYRLFGVTTCRTRP